MAKAPSNPIQQDSLDADQGSLYREVMQESYNTIFMASGLFAYLEQGQKSWAPDFQRYCRDAEERLFKRSRKQGPEVATWWNSYRSPVNVRSSDSSGPDELSEEEEEESNVKREGPRVMKPRASLLGKSDAGSMKAEARESGNNHPQGHLGSDDPANEKDGDLAGNENSQQEIDPRGSQNMCFRCGKKYGRKSSLNRHLKTHSRKRPHICATCGKDFVERSQLIAHTQVHTKNLRLRREPYECPECGEDFYIKTSFNEHLATHTNEPAYLCPDCGESFEVERDLDRHVMEVHSGATLFECPDCGKAFMKEEDLTLHQTANHAEGNFYGCPDYGTSDREELPLITQERPHARERPCRCSECREGFRDNGNLESHWRMQDEGSPHLTHETYFVQRPAHITNRESDAEEYSHACSVCGRCFKNRRCFANHWRMHMREQQRGEAGAGDVVKEEARLTRNRETQIDLEYDACFDCGKPLCADSTQPKIEMEENLHKCPDCGRLFRESQCFANHWIREHQETHQARTLPADQLETRRNKGSYKCPSCERVYTTLYSLRRHWRIHSECRRLKRSGRGKGFASFPGNRKPRVKGECSPHKCSFCAKGFSAKSVSRRRLPARVKARRYKCAICGKAFAYKHTLARHQEAHEDEQPYLHKCSFCRKAFRTWSSLNRHLQLHMGDKPYQCTVCGKAFAYRYALTQHREMHMAGQLHRCTLCLKTFPTRNSLSRHRRIHLKTRSYQCSVCWNSFGTKDSLRRHQEMHSHGSPGKLTGGGEDSGNSFSVAKEEASTTKENSNGSPDISTLSGHDDVCKEKESSESVGDSSLSTHLEEDSSKGLQELNSTFGDGSVLPEYQARHADGSVNTWCENSIHSKHQGVHVEGNAPECSGKTDSSDLTGQEEPITGLDGDRTISRDGSMFAHNPTSDPEGTSSLWTDRSACSGHQGAPLGENPPESSGEGKTFVDSSVLAEHQSTHLEEHPVNGLEGKEPVRVNSLHQSHQGVVPGKGSHTCLICGKSYREKYSLARHQVTHTSARPYQCQTCAKTFQDPRILAKHQLTHTDNKTNLCHECGKCFKTRCSLVRHLKVHRERPYCCVFCGKRLTTGPNLQYHVRLHTGERPHKCTECDKAYATPWALKTHLKTHLKTSFSQAHPADQLDRVS